MMEEKIVDKQSKPGKESNLFDNFKKFALDYFTFLVKDYGFELVSTTILTPECSIRYQNQTTGVIILYELGGVPGVGISKLERKGNRVVEGKEYSLDRLMSEWCPTQVVRRNFKFAEATSENIEEILKQYATILRKYGRDVLKGKFALFQTL